jgi:subtilisin family serine protease
VQRYRHTLDHALPLEKVPDAWNQIGGVGNAGVGIRVAVLDTGIDPQHPGFSDASLVPPDGFPKSDNASDAMFATNKIIVTRSYGQSVVDGTIVPALPTDGHGTGVSMIVAGANVAGPLARFLASRRKPSSAITASSTTIRTVRLPRTTGLSQPSTTPFPTAWTSSP